MSFEDMFVYDLLSEVPRWLKRIEESIIRSENWNNALENLIEPTDVVSFRNKIVFLDPDDMDKVSSPYYDLCYSYDSLGGMEKHFRRLLERLESEGLDPLQIEEALSREPSPEKCPEKVRKSIAVGYYSSKGWPEEGIYGPTIFLCPERIEERARSLYGEYHDTGVCSFPFKLLSATMQHEMVHSYIDAHRREGSPVEVLGPFYRKVIEEGLALTFELKYYEKILGKIDKERLLGYLFRKYPREYIGCSFFLRLNDLLLDAVLNDFPAGFGSHYYFHILPAILFPNRILGEYLWGKMSPEYLLEQVFQYLMGISPKLRNLMVNLEMLDDVTFKRAIWTLFAMRVLGCSPKNY